MSSFIIQYIEDLGDTHHTDLAFQTRLSLQPHSLTTFKGANLLCKPTKSLALASDLYLYIFLVDQSANPIFNL